MAVVIAVNEHRGARNVAIDHCALHLAFDEGPYQIGNGRQRGAVIVLIRADAIQPFARDVGDGGAEKSSVRPATSSCCVKALAASMRWFSVVVSLPSVLLAMVSAMAAGTTLPPSS